MGVFNAVTVRTLNRNDEDRIRYSIGADITLQEEWPSTGGNLSDLGLGMESASDEPVYYTEPRFAKYQGNGNCGKCCPRAAEGKSFHYR